MEDVMKNVKPTIVGRIRKEAFGGIYYERDRLVIELLNDSAYEILSLCQQGKTQEEIEQYLLSEYEADPHLIKDDLQEYLSYLTASKFIQNGKDVKKDCINMKKIPTQDMYDRNYTLGLPPYVLSAPLKVLIELTHICNLKCVHCFADADFCKYNEKGYIEGELTTQQWYKVIDNILEAGVFEILLSGGEATMRKDLLDIAKYIQSKGASYCLLSNATLIDDKLAKGLKSTGCEKVESNMDGYDAKTYDCFRGVAGSFDATIRGIKACIENGIPVRCNVMETKMNIFGLKKIVDKAYEIGVREVCVVPLESGGRAKVNTQLAFQEDDVEELRAFYKDVVQWFDEKYGETDMVLCTPNMLNIGDEGRYAKVFDSSGIMPACGAGKIHCTVDPYGDVKLCPNKCIYCYNDSHNRRTQELSSKKKMEIANQLIEAGIFQVCLTGGEPLACPEYLDLLRYFRTNGVLVGSIFSGGCMTPAKINQICEYVSMIQVSLDGSTSEIHDRVRGREGSFDEAVTTIKAFVAKGKQVKVSFATTKYNIDDLENTYKLCESLGVSSFRTQKLSISGRVKGHEESIYATEKQIRRFETFIYNQRGKGIPIEFRSPAEHVQFGVKNGYAIVARINSEGLVGISPYIDAYFGDLKKESLKEIWDRMKMGWHNPEMLELAKKMDERGNGTLIDTLEERLMIGEV